MKYTDKIYGEIELSGVMEELIKTDVFQRLKKIHQGGAIFLVNPETNHTRFEHSIGVMLLIRKLGGSLEEQIAGLIHDISHTAFSHLIDYILEIEEEDYHEKRFAEVLKDHELSQVLRKYGFESNSFLKLEKYRILEYPLPNLSADRIDYTLRDLFQIGEISKNEIDWLLGGLIVYENRIVFKALEYGQWFQAKYTFLVSEYFGGKENRQANLIMKRIASECLREGIIKESDFYEDDFYLLEKIEQVMDLRKRIDELRSEKLDSESLKIKKRMVDPEIWVDGKVSRLSEIN